MPYLLSGLQAVLPSKASLLRVSQNRDHLEGTEGVALQLSKLSRQHSDNAFSSGLCQLRQMERTLPCVNQFFSLFFFSFCSLKTESIWIHQSRQHFPWNQTCTEFYCERSCGVATDRIYKKDFERHSGKILSIPFLYEIENCCPIARSLIDSP